MIKDSRRANKKRLARVVNNRNDCENTRNAPVQGEYLGRGMRELMGETEVEDEGWEKAALDNAPRLIEPDAIAFFGQVED